MREVLLKKETGVKGVANSEDPTFPTSRFCLRLILAYSNVLAQLNDSIKITHFPAVSSCEG